MNQPKAHNVTVSAVSHKLTDGSEVWEVLGKAHGENKWFTFCMADKASAQQLAGVINIAYQEGKILSIHI